MIDADPAPRWPLFLPMLLALTGVCLALYTLYGWIGAMQVQLGKVLAGG